MCSLDPDGFRSLVSYLSGVHLDTLSITEFFKGRLTFPSGRNYIG